MGFDNLSVYCDAAFGIDEKSRSYVCRYTRSVQVGEATYRDKDCAEAELVSLCEGVTLLMGCRNFLMVKMKPSTVYENNRLSGMVKSDGTFSLRTRHLNINLFLLSSM